MKSQWKVAICAVLSANLVGLSPCAAQTPTPTATATVAPTANPDMLQTEGISNDIDAHMRDPLLSVSTTIDADSVTILADALEQHGEFTKYPIQFDFFVNRTLFTSQYRSTELPGAVGVTIPSKVATVPFTYVVVAKVLHPNRTFTTVLQGTVENVTPTPTNTPGSTSALNCTLVDSRSDPELSYTADSVSFSSTGTSISASFTATNSDDDSDTIPVKLSGTLTDSSLSGSLTITEESTPESLTVSGSVTGSSSTLGAVNAATSDSTVSLSCE